MHRHGVVLIDKHQGISSRQVVDAVMKALKVKKAGHFGALDPFATGLVCVGIGQGTKLLPYLKDRPKEYYAVIGFEMKTDTDDITGVPIEQYPGVEVDVSRIEQWLNDHKRWFIQVPPQYCAQKQKGVPMYKLKRADKDVTPRPKQVSISEGEILSSGSDWVKIRIVCSRGTYVRAIARDIGSCLGCGGYLKELRRTQSEGFSVEQAVKLDSLAQKVAQDESLVIPMLDVLRMPTIRVIPEGVRGIRDGRAIQISWLMDDCEVEEGERVAVVDEEMRLLCIAHVKRYEGIFGYIERGFNL